MRISFMCAHFSETISAKWVLFSCLLHVNGLKSLVSILQYLKTHASDKLLWWRSLNQSKISTGWQISTGKREIVSTCILPTFQDTINSWQIKLSPVVFSLRNTSHYESTKGCKWQFLMTLRQSNPLNALYILIFMQHLF